MLLTPKNLIQTADKPSITFGGTSSSEVLRQVNDRILADILGLYSNIDELDQRLESANSVFTLQAGVLANQVAALSTSVSALTSGLADSYNTTIVDMYTLDYVTDPTDAGATEADVSTTYGQATLQVTNSQDKLVTEDSQGNIWVPDTVQVGYCYKDSATAIPTDGDYLPDDGYVYALDGRSDTAWAVKHDVADARGYIWVRVRVPSEVFAGATANCICLHPFPSITHDLVKVEYRSVGGGWTPCDLSYITGWTGSLVSNFANLRLLFPPTDVYELRIKIKVTDADATYWGFTKIELKMLDFAATSKLNLDFGPIVGAASYTSPQYTLRGKDQSSLAYLSTTVNGGGKKVEIDLTQSAAGTSPVITSVTSEWT